ncbi:uncharacterized protein [Ptychodera flava]|uniref:uncharacterized protein isoform X2 n=1 Tax=Ptychodera flava TaxID=63121 RepID=UPI00396A9954
MESIEMPDVKPKQVLRVFTKLESFKGARDKVIEILQNSDLDPRKIDIQSHELSWTQQDYDGIGNTSMVVIDARQTRTLITPERRDDNVDHWNELKKLQAMSKPPGSILVIIYGDEHSKNLPEDQLLASTWETLWKFNDPVAYSLAEKGVCFSLFQSFNETQRQTIRQYFDEIIFVPEAKKDSNILVLGNKYGKMINKVMDKHPTLANERDDNRNTNNAGAYTISLVSD